MNGTAQSVRGRALIAAAGGFEANIEWLKQYWGDAADNFLIRGTPYNRGDVLKMLLDAGVAPVGDPTQCHAVAIDARAPKFDGGIATRLDSDRVRHHGQPRAPGASTTRARTPGPSAMPSGAGWWRSSRGRSRYSIIDAKSIRLFMPSIFPAVEAESIARARGEALARPDCARKNRRRFQRRGAARHIRPHRARRLRN